MKMTRFLKALSPTLALLLIIIIVVAVLSFTEYKPEEIHYKGESTLTTAQLYELMKLPRDEDGYLKDINHTREFYYKIEDDSIVFTYDFYSKIQFSFLEVKSIGDFSDNPVFYGFISRYGEEGYGQWIAMAAILAIIGVGTLWASRNQRKTIAFINKILGMTYERIDSHYPEVSTYNIVNNFSKFNTSEAKGIICARSWKPNKEGNLKSLVQDTVWKDREINADKNPSQDNWSGVYAYRVGSLLVQKSDIIGIVEMDGKYEYHPDGVVRSEHCKILGLFIRSSRPRLGKLLSNKYSVPVYFCNTAVEGYLDWLYSDYGFQSLKHNSEILEHV